MDRKTFSLMIPIFLLGIALLVGSIWFLISLKTIVNEGTLKAKSYDARVVGSFSTYLVKTEVTPAQRVMSESDTQTLTVSVTNLDTQACDEAVSLNAPEFDVSPNTLESYANHSCPERTQFRMDFDPAKTWDFLARRLFLIS